jgi:hypothetical protein
MLPLQPFDQEGFEFAADFDLVANPATLARWSWPQEQFGLMLYDVFHPDERKRGFVWFSLSQNYTELNSDVPSVEAAKGRGHFGEVTVPRACFFRASIQDAVMNCHPDTVEIRATHGPSGYNAANNS